MIIWSSRYEREVLERYFVHKKDLFWGEESFFIFWPKEAEESGRRWIFWAFLGSVADVPASKARHWWWVISEQWLA